MGCFILLFMLIGPRVALIFTWIFTDLVTRAFTALYLPLLGLIFLPWTTLFYVLVYQPVGGVEGIGWAFVVLGFIFDISSYTGGARQSASRGQA